MQKKKQERPILLTSGAVESYAIPHWAKAQAKGRRIRVLTRPFKWGLGYATQRMTTENEEVFCFNQVLRQDELDLINHAVGSEELRAIKAFLMQNCSVHDTKNLTWSDILAHLEVYLHSKKETTQKTEPAETGRDITTDKRRGIKAWFKGSAKELYGLTIERITKAYLDKYG